MALLTRPPVKRTIQPWEQEAQVARQTYGVAMNDPSQGGMPPPDPPPTTTPGIPDRPGDFGTGQILLDAGYTPDYAALMRSDPTLMGNEAELGRLEGQIPLARREALRRAVVQAGLVPAGYQDADIDAGTILAAQENKFSSAAELARARSRGSGDLLHRLAARGMVYSGGLAGGETRLQEGYERGTNQVTQGLLDAISTFTKEAEAKKYSIAQQRAQLREAAAMRISQDPRYRPRPPTYGNPPITAPSEPSNVPPGQDWGNPITLPGGVTVGGGWGVPPSAGASRPSAPAAPSGPTYAGDFSQGGYPDNPQAGATYLFPAGPFRWTGNGWVAA